MADWQGLMGLHNVEHKIKKKMVKTISIDFDNTVHNNKDLKYPNMGYPMPGAKEALDQLKSDGYRIIIFSVRASGDIKYMEKWLNDFEIPFDKITNVKEASEFYVDDKAIRFEGNWPKILEQIKILQK
jgi:FMN phosphatase YigB (HAD superfamily)